MKVRQLLELINVQPLSVVKPEGQQVLELINKYSPNTYDIVHFTGSSALDMINDLPPAEANLILETELNDGLDLTSYRKELQNVVDGSKSGLSRSIVVGIMTFLVAASSITYIVCMAYVSYHMKTLPGWTEIALPFGVPGMVIWKYFGIINKERTDLLMAAIGKAPANPVNVIAEVTRRVRND